MSTTNAYHQNPNNLRITTSIPLEVALLRIFARDSFGCATTANTHRPHLPPVRAFFACSVSARVLDYPCLGVLTRKVEIRDQRDPYKAKCALGRGKVAVTVLGGGGLLCKVA